MLLQMHLVAMVVIPFSGLLLLLAAVVEVKVMEIQQIQQ